MKRYSLWLLLSALVIVFSGVMSVRTFAGEKITVTDMGKRVVEVPLNPRRILCFSPGTLRLIVYLEATDRVVGVEGFEKTRPIGRPYMYANPQLTKLPTVGPGGPGSINKEPDLEAVLKVKPDLIFISYMEPTNADELQKKLSIPVVLLTHGRFASFDEAVYGSLRLGGKILKAEKKAEEVIGFIEGARKDLQSRIQGVPETEKPIVYVGSVGYKGVQGIESTDASFTPLDWVGARNLAKTVTSKDHLFIDKEKLLEWNPEIIFLDGGGLNLVKQDFAKKPDYYKGLKAFRDKKVYVIYPFNYYVTNVSTAIADAYAVGKILYPERFRDVDAAAKADEIYTSMYGKPLYSLMEKDFGPLGRVGDFQK